MSPADFARIKSPPFKSSARRLSPNHFQENITAEQSFKSELTQQLRR
jgi:hypothetical protein